MEIHQDSVPLRIDESGAVRVANTRVLFVLVIFEFQKGATPEQIAGEIYTSLALPDVYAVIAYYLRHREEVDRYIREWEQEAARLRQMIEARQGPPRVTRDVLQARWEELEQKRAASRQ